MGFFKHYTTPATKCFPHFGIFTDTDSDWEGAGCGGVPFNEKDPKSKDLLSGFRFSPLCVTNVENYFCANKLFIVLLSVEAMQKGEHSLLSEALAILYLQTPQCY